MKKLLSLCLAALLLCGCQPVQSDPTENTTEPALISTTPSADAIQPSTQTTSPSTEPTEPKFLGSESYRLAPSDQLPYLSDGGYRPYIETEHDLMSLPLGALYALNKKTDTLTQIHPGPIYYNRSTKDHLYYIVDSQRDRIYRSDYTGQEQEVIYQTEEEQIICFSYWGLDPSGRLYVLLDNNSVVEYYIAEDSTQTVMEQYRVEWAQIYYDKSKKEPYLEWTGDLSEGAEEKTYWYYFRTGEQVEQPEQQF